MKRINTLKRHRTPYGWIYLFLAPTLILFSMYTLYPIGATVWYSLTNMRSFTSRNIAFVGLANYRALFADSQFLNSLSVTGRFLLMAVPARFVLSLLLALLLNWKRCMGKTFFRTMFFLPVLTTSAIIGVVFIMILDPTMGPVNIILNRLNIQSLASVSLLGNFNTALPTTAIVWVWKWLGNSLIYWIASLQSVPDELYEAARIDGANSWQLFKSIVVPLLIPFAVIILILTVSDAIRVFNLMLTLTNGGPFFATETVEVFIYRHAFQASSPRMAYASAAAAVFGFAFMMIVVIQRIANAAVKRGEQ
ncbi:MAG: sugar ABC transporter permease [Clostridia bacterium]|nr:sugar ABC transporter permease [Clostridia bacterium]